MVHQIKILLVEDDADDQVYFSDALAFLNLDVFCDIANNGNEALQHIQIPPPPNIIFMDLNMPMMSGYECLEKIKRVDIFKNIPIVIFTTSRNQQDIERTKRLGASLYFTKPANFNILCEKLNEIIHLDFTHGYIV